jgi:GNAT superfamily N-acetyltransferase
MNVVVAVSAEAEPAFDRIVGDGLNAFNDAVVGYADRVPLRVIVRDSDNGQILGGIVGRSSLGLMFLDQVYLPESLRGQDIGTKMLAMAEEEGRRRGCKAGVSTSVWDGASSAKCRAILRGRAECF